jgi:hypothetical protein
LISPSAGTTLVRMIEQLSDMPPGTLGFVITGDLTRDEYRQILLPPVKEAVESGRGIRMLVQIGPGFDEFEPGAVFEDAKQGWNLGIRHHDAWERTALVTDDEWIARAFRMFAWLAPGDLRTYGLEEVDEARAWLAT